MYDVTRWPNYVTTLPTYTQKLAHEGLYTLQNKHRSTGMYDVYKITIQDVLYDVTRWPNYVTSHERNRSTGMYDIYKYLAIYTWESLIFFWNQPDIDMSFMTEL